MKEFLQGEIALLDAQKAAIEEELRIVEEQIANDSATRHQVEEGALTQAEERQRTTADCASRLPRHKRYSAPHWRNARY